VTSPPADELAARLIPDGAGGVAAEASASPAIVARTVGQGRVVYLAAGIDAGLWSYAYPYERILFTRAMTWAAGDKPPITVEAPRCVETTFYRRPGENGAEQTVVHFLNNVHTTAGHGHPAADVPLREESIPISGIRITFHGAAPVRFHVEPGGEVPVVVTRDGDSATVELGPLHIHCMLVGESA